MCQRQFFSGATVAAGGIESRAYRDDQWDDGSGDACDREPATGGGGAAAEYVLYGMGQGWSRGRPCGRLRADGDGMRDLVLHAGDSAEHGGPRARVGTTR